MNLGKLGEIAALFLIAFAVSASSAYSIGISVTYPVGGEQIDFRHMDINWTSSGCFETPQVALYYDLNNNFDDGAAVIKSGEADDGNYVWDLLGVQAGEYYVAARYSCANPFEIVTNYSKARFAKLGFNMSYASSSFTVTVNSSQPPNITYISPDNNKYVRGKQAIVFNVSDTDGDDLYGSIYYSSSRGSFENVIAENIELSAYCSDLDSSTATPNNCTYIWGTAGIEGDYYIDIIVYDGIYNATNSSASTLNITNSFTASVLHPNDVVSFETRNITINWTAYDVMPGFAITGADIYYDNDNSALTGRTLLIANTTSNYTWDTYGVPKNTSYYVCINAYSTGLDNQSNSMTLSYYDCSDNAFTLAGEPLEYSSNIMHSIVSINNPPYVNLTYPNSGSFTTNITILFNVSDSEGNDLIASLYYSSSPGAFENIIAEGLDLSDSSVCTDTDLNTTTENNCSYFWNTTELSSDYYIDLLVYDGIAYANDSSASAISIANIPIMGSLIISNITQSTMHLSWLTNQPANTTVYFWIDSSHNYTNSSSILVESHNITVTGLKGNTFYYYYAESCNSGGSCIQSEVYNFTTLNNPAFISITYPNGGEILEEQYVDINWTAYDIDGDEVLISIYYDINSIKDDGRVLLAANISNTGNYVWDIISLAKSRYYISIDALSYDLLNNTNVTSTDYSDSYFTKGDLHFEFSSSIMHSNVTANSLPNVEVTYPNSGSFTANITIHFNVSDGDSDPLLGSLYYSSSPGAFENIIAEGLDLSDLSVCTDNDASTATPNNCSYFWDTSALNSNYYIVISAYDTVSISNGSSSSILEIDNIPIISNVSAINITGNSTAIAWITNEDANSTVHYWINSTHNYTASNETYLKNHAISLTGLLSNRRYYYYAESCDSTGNCVQSSVYNFTTLNNLPVVAVVYPNGGEIISARNITIIWTAYDVDGDPILVDLYYDINDNSADGWTLIAGNLSNTGNYEWHISGLQPGNYKIGIKVGQYSAANDSIVHVVDYSDDYFTFEGSQIGYSSWIMHSVVSKNIAPKINLTYPNFRTVFRDTVSLKFNVSDENEDDLYIHSFMLYGEVYKRQITVNNSNNFDLENYPVNITLDTFLLAEQDKMRRDGQKFRIIVGGREVSWYNSTSFNNVATRIWFPLNISKSSVRDDIYIVYGRDSFVAVERWDAPWDKFISKQNLLLGRPVSAVTQAMGYPASNTNDGSYSTKWMGTNYDLSLNESKEFLKYTLAEASRAYKIDYRLTGSGIENTKSVFIRPGGNTTFSHVFNSSISHFTKYIEPASLNEFVVDIRSIIAHPEFYEVEVYEPVLLNAKMGPEENATQIMDAQYAYLGGTICTDPDNDLSTPNNCSFSFSSGQADGIYTLCINITDGEDFGYDCSAETIVINTLNAAPNMSSVFMASENGTFSEKEHLYCWANATDPDEDDFSFEGFWFRNGEIVPELNFTTYPSLNFTGDLVNVGFAPWTAIEDGENWSCSVRAYDLRAYSPYKSSGNITIIFGGMRPQIHSVWHYVNFTRMGGIITVYANVTDNNTQVNIADVILQVVPAQVGIARNYSMSQVGGSGSHIWAVNYTAFHSGSYAYSVHARDFQNLYAIPVAGSYGFSAEGMAYASIVIDDANKSFTEGDIIYITDSS